MQSYDMDRMLHGPMGKKLRGYVVGLQCRKDAGWTQQLPCGPVPPRWMSRKARVISMKRRSKILAGITLTIGLCFLGVLWLITGSPLPSIPPSRTPPPVGFDAAEYAALPSVRTTDDAEVLNIGSYGNPFDANLHPAALVTSFHVNTDDDRRRLLFVDRSGKLIGEIADNSELRSAGSFMIAPGGYYEISTDSISRRLPMTYLGEINDRDLRRLIEQSELYASFDETISMDSLEGGSTMQRNHLMRHRGVWKRAVTQGQEYYPWKTGDLRDFEGVYDIGRSNASNDAPNFFGGRYRVELTHFDQQEFFPHRNAPMGSTTGTPRYAHWTGTGYYTVLADDRPVLRFRVDRDREYVGEMSGTTLVAEGLGSLDFVILQVTDHNNRRDMVVVSIRDR
ncbi:hypothetical protein P8Q88_03500 [Qipengyuania sp. XHP0207]|uniref:hypothetical protein n=1 Tax=Qipengyuania sp. XHP0207 TaxID=3038078 RepID=UPI00241C3A8F|nr:hypothetical protein [Qipengyuania sp. XHP0207]MDG5747237.1 hypothetical protein [Qipengyuania sp. XHP0207]